MPECYADTLLIETLVPTKSGYNHKFGCFNVEAEMKHGKLKDKFAVGIIDKDKTIIGYLVEFEEIDKVEGSLILWRHKKREKHHFVIQICPALERWVLEVCDVENIDIHGLGLSSDLEGLKKFSKTRKSIEDKSLMALFREISLRENNVNVRKIKAWVTLLKEKNYQVDIKALQHG